MLKGDLLVVIWKNLSFVSSYGGTAKQRVAFSIHTQVEHHAAYSHYPLTTYYQTCVKMHLYTLRSGMTIQR